tara:strand:- start:54115 stop:54711 length:597 start_codon:yes stop_codon:yes gene_type:complete
LLNLTFIGFKKVLVRLILKCLGWKIEGHIPANIDKLVLIGVPHTSNWDFFVMLGCAWHFGLNIKWLGKESLFSNIVMRTLSTMMGGIKVDRSNADQTVDKIATTLTSCKQRIALAIAPEGTRSKKPGWRSGFFYIAQQAKIPLGLGYADYPNKIMGVGPILYELKDIDNTMQTIQNFYKDIVGKNPENKSPIRISSNL